MDDADDPTAANRGRSRRRVLAAAGTALGAALPIEGQAARWGDELYFDASLAGKPETTSEAVPVGTLAYWASGEAIALFWGPTPASTDETPRAAGPVAPLARVEDVSPLDAIEGGATVRIDLGED